MVGTPGVIRWIQKKAAATTSNYESRVHHHYNLHLHTTAIVHEPRYTSGSETCTYIVYHSKKCFVPQDYRPPSRFRKKACVGFAIVEFFALDKELPGDRWPGERRSAEKDVLFLGRSPISTRDTGSASHLRAKFTNTSLFLTSGIIFTTNYTG